MILPKLTVDDFKEERRDVTPPLPIVLRIVPLLFYLSIFAALVLCSIFLVQIQVAASSIKTYEQGIADVKADMENTATMRTQLEGRILRATDVQNWVEGSTPVQPLAVAAARSISPDSMLADLRLDRDPDSPASIRFGMRVSASTMEQIDKTTTALGDQHYRVIQPQQTLSDGQIDYRATLVSPGGSSSGATAPPEQPQVP